MTQAELVELISQYPEWEFHLDETACATGYGECPICEGGGYFDKRKKCPPTHKEDCPRLKFETYKKQNET